MKLLSEPEPAAPAGQVGTEAQPLTAVLHHTPSGAGTEPAWLGRARRDARRWIDAHGFPTRKDEDWRYLPLAPVLAEVVVPEPPGRVPPQVAGPASRQRCADAVEAASLGLGGARLVFVNGHFDPSLSRRAGLPPGARVVSLAATLAGEPELARPVFSSSGDAAHAFLALNTALAGDGALVQLPAQTTIADPIELIFFSDPEGAAGLYSPRSFVELGEGSSATLVEVHAGAPGSRYITNAVARFALGEGAELHRYQLQVESERAVHFSSVEVRQAAGSRFATSLVGLGAETARDELRVTLSGEGADASLDALYLPSGVQHHDHPVLVEHLAPRCTSSQRYVGIVDGDGHAVFDGHVVVRPGAIRTDASQSNKNLLLSERAEVDTRPRLEIFCDDVACAHGAAVGRLDEEALFYLRSRGIPRERARSILVQGFAAHALGRISLAGVRARAERLLADRLGVEPAGLPASEERAGGVDDEVQEEVTTR